MSIERMIARNIKEVEKVTCRNCGTRKYTRFKCDAIGVDEYVKCMCHCESLAYDKYQDKINEARVQRENEKAERNTRKRM